MNWAAGDDLREMCRSALWDRIDGWEVVMAVLLIMSAYAVVQLGRMYFMYRTAAINRECHCKPRELEGEDGV